MRIDHPRRVLGRFTGSEKGPLLIAIGGIHGNEPAGVKAIDLMLKMLEVEPITNPDFTFKGKFVGILGNIRAYIENERFIYKDLNRIFTQELIESARRKGKQARLSEEDELVELLDAIEAEVRDYNPDKLIILDLHTTSSFGGIFSLVTEDPESIHLAIELHAPVIRGMLEGLHGTTLHYFNQVNFDIPKVTTITFESGQHNELLSVNRAIAAITNCMRTIGCVMEEHVENRHDRLLIEFSKGLPKVASLVTRHDIAPQDRFVMQPNFGNFQKVSRGEWLAEDRNGKIFANHDGLLLMPLYQKQGDEGFFIVRSLEEHHELLNVIESAKNVAVDHS